MSTVPLHIQTPLVHSPKLSQVAGCPVFLKMDALQPSGSFKIRGVGHLVQSAVTNGAKILVSSSGGNAGLATSHSARVLGIPATVVVPITTPELARSRLREDGAEVIVHGENWNAADAKAREIFASYPAGHAAYIPPFDHPLIWTGNASIVEEIKAQWQAGTNGQTKPGAILLSVGGGGLYVGVVEGLRRVGWDDVPVITAETQGAASFYEAHRQKQLITLDKIDTIATTLGARTVAKQAFDDGQTHPTECYTVSDAQAVDACGRFLDDHRVLVEPSCGTTLALVYRSTPTQKDQRIAFEPSRFSSLVVIVCGGAGVNHQLLHKWTRDLGLDQQL